MAKILFVLDEVLFRADGRRAGLQIRAAGMAEALAKRGHHIVVAEPRPGSSGDQSPAWRFVGLDTIASELPVAASIVHPLLLERHYGVLRACPIVADAYEFPFGSWLSHSASQLPRLGERVMYDYRRTMATYLRALVRADRVLCGTEAQRHGYLSILCTLGRINPRHYDADLVLTVPSGAPPDPPVREMPTDARLIAIKRSGLIVLWYGGIYPWFDIDTYLGAMPLIADEVPSVQFLFAGIGGVDHRQGQPLTHPGAAKLLEHVQRDAGLRARTHFVDHVPYGERHQLFQASDVGVCTYGDHLETTFAMRGRLIDMIWGGLPPVATTGDAMSERLQAGGAGIAVPAGDAAALARAVASLLRDRVRSASMSAKARQLATTSLSWDHLVEPLHRYCSAPPHDPSRGDAFVARTAGRIVGIQDGAGWRLRDRYMRARSQASRVLSGLVRRRSSG
jgi:glycosyltransferase involved in cell wall biosynthesis